MTSFEGNTLEDWLVHFNLNKYKDYLTSEVGISDLMDLKEVYESEEKMETIKSQMDLLNFKRFRNASSLTAFSSVPTDHQSDRFKTTSARGDSVVTEKSSKYIGFEINKSVCTDLTSNTEVLKQIEESNSRSVHPNAVGANEDTKYPLVFSPPSPILSTILEQKLKASLHSIRDRIDQLKERREALRSKQTWNREEPAELSGDADRGPWFGENLLPLEKIPERIRELKAEFELLTDLLQNPEKTYSSDVEVYVGRDREEKTKNNKSPTIPKQTYFTLEAPRLPISISISSPPQSIAKKILKSTSTKSSSSSSAISSPRPISPSSRSSSRSRSSPREKERTESGRERSIHVRWGEECYVWRYPDPEELYEAEEARLKEDQLRMKRLQETKRLQQRDKLDQEETERQRQQREKIEMERGREREIEATRQRREREQYLSKTQNSFPRYTPYYSSYNPGNQSYTYPKFSSKTNMTSLTNDCSSSKPLPKKDDSTSNYPQDSITDRLSYSTRADPASSFLESRRANEHNKYCEKVNKTSKSRFTSTSYTETSKSKSTCCSFHDRYFWY